MHFDAGGASLWAIQLDGIELAVFAKQPAMLGDELSPLSLSQPWTSFAFEMRSEFRIALDPASLFLSRCKVRQLRLDFRRSRWGPRVSPFFRYDP